MDNKYTKKPTRLCESTLMTALWGFGLGVCVATLILSKPSYEQKQPEVMRKLTTTSITQPTTQPVYNVEKEYQK